MEYNYEKRIYQIKKLSIVIDYSKMLERTNSSGTDPNPLLSKILVILVISVIHSLTMGLTKNKIKWSPLVNGSQ
jgi:hypothetical protein